jgi:hypothetical protein
MLIMQGATNSPVALDNEHAILDVPILPFCCPATIVTAVSLPPSLPASQDSTHARYCYSCSLTQVLPLCAAPVATTIVIV